MFRAEQCLPTQISQGVNERLDYEQAFIVLALRHGVSSPASQV